MKRNLAWFFLGLIALLGIAAAVDVSTSNLYIQNSEVDVVKIRVRTADTQTAPWLEFNNNGTLAFSLPATGIVPAAYGGTGAATPAAAKLAFGIQSGTNVIAADHTVTNTFSPAFSAAPIVTVTGWTQGPATNAFILSVSTTNVIVAGTATVPIHWIAVGAP
jgi:hypothetical protein